MSSDWSISRNLIGRATYLLCDAQLVIERRWWSIYIIALKMRWSFSWLMQIIHILWVIWNDSFQMTHAIKHFFIPDKELKNKSAIESSVGDSRPSSSQEKKQLVHDLLRKILCHLNHSFMDKLKNKKNHWKQCLQFKHFCSTSLSKNSLMDLSSSRGWDPVAPPSSFDRLK